MSQTFYVLIAGIFLCVIGFFVERNYLIATTVKAIPIAKEQDFSEKIIGKFLKQDHDIITNKAIIAQFESITAKLLNTLPASQYHYKILIKKSPEVNAYTYPGGYVIITTGLIKFADNADEMLAVLAHELGHVNKRHVLIGMVETTGISTLSAILFGNMNQTIGSIANNGSMLLQYKFSREYEKEADIAAVDYLANAQINPREFINFFVKLQKTETLNLEFISSHPLTQKRQDYVKNYIDKNNFTNFPPLQINYSEFKALF